MNNGAAGGEYIGSGLLLFYVQQWMKSDPVLLGIRPFAWYSAIVTALPGADKWAHRIFAGLGALFAAAGIHYTTDGACSWADGCHGTFSIPDGWSALHGVWEWAKVYMIQQGMYDATRTTRPSMQPSTAHTVETEAETADKKP